jgi:hypothetical protein
MQERRNGDSSHLSPERTTPPSEAVPASRRKFRRLISAAGEQHGELWHRWDVDSVLSFFNTDMRHGLQQDAVRENLKKYRP